MKFKVNSFPPACSDHSNHVRHEGNHGISTAFFRPDFKGARSRACVRACVDDGESGREAFVEPLCRRFAEETSLSSDCATGRTSFRPAESKAKGDPDRCPLDPRKNDPSTLWLEATKTAPESRRDFSAPRERETGFDEFDRQVFDSQVLE